VEVFEDIYAIFYQGWDLGGCLSRSNFPLTPAGPQWGVVLVPRIEIIVQIVGVLGFRSQRLAMIRIVRTDLIWDNDMENGLNIPSREEERD
jgi:hypothetical protein